MITIDDFILDAFTWSYSRLNTYHTCPKEFLLVYGERKARKQNVFAEFGLLIHELLEEWWDEKISTENLSFEYLIRYGVKVKLPFPPNLLRYKTDEKYFQQGREFFDNFNLVRSDWELLGNELTIESLYNGRKITIRPDLLVRKLEDGKVYIADYKTCTPPFTKTGRIQKKNVEPHLKQLSLYAHFVEKEMDIRPDFLQVYYPRGENGKSDLYVTSFTTELENQALSWVDETIDTIYSTNHFLETPDDFYCKNLCNVRAFCDYGKSDNVYVPEGEDFRTLPDFF